MRKIIKLLNDGILVELEPNFRKGVIIQDIGRGGNALRIGRVLLVGRGKQHTDKFVAMPDIMGKRVGFLILSALLRPEQCDHLPDEHIVIKQGDLLFTVEDGVDVEVDA